MVRKLTIKDHIRETNLFNSRTLIVAFIVTGLVIVLISRMLFLQVNKYQDLQTLSNQNRIKITPIAPNRGLIYDRNGVILAENRSLFSLEIVPEKSKDLDATLSELQIILPIISDEDIEQFKKTAKQQRRFKKITLKTGLSESDRAIFAVNQYRFPGVSAEAGLFRYYPFGETMVHSLEY